MDQRTRRPTPGSVKTSSTTTVPPSRMPIWRPATVTMGMSAFLSACFMTTAQPARPLAAVAPNGGDDAGGDAQHEREPDGEERQLDRHREALEDQADDRLARAPRGSEIALGEAPEPARVLEPPGLVETEEVPELRDHLRAHDGIGADHLLDDRSRDQPEHEEDEHRQPEERQGHRVRPHDEIAPHPQVPALSGSPRAPRAHARSSQTPSKP